MAAKLTNRKIHHQKVKNFALHKRFLTKTNAQIWPKNSEKTGVVRVVNQTCDRAKGSIIFQYHLTSLINQVRCFNLPMIEKAYE